MHTHDLLFILSYSDDDQWPRPRRISALFLLLHRDEGAGSFVSSRHRVLSALINGSSIFLLGDMDDAAYSMLMRSPHMERHFVVKIYKNYEATLPGASECLSFRERRFISVGPLTAQINRCDEC